MNENNNEKTNEYTGEYGNSVEGGTKPQDGMYSYSYKERDNSATHSGDYYESNNASQQGSFAIYIKFLELQYTLQFLRLRPQPRIPFSKPLSADLFSGDNSDTIELLDELLPFSGPEERTRIENMKNMLQNIAKMKEMMEMMEMMKEMFPEGFGSAGENSMDFFSGMAGMPDMSSVFEMFGKEV